VLPSGPDHPSGPPGARDSGAADLHQRMGSLAAPLSTTSTLSPPATPSPRGHPASQGSVNTGSRPCGRRCAGGLPRPVSSAAPPGLPPYALRAGRCGCGSTSSAFAFARPSLRSGRASAALQMSSQEPPTIGRAPARALFRSALQAGACRASRAPGPRAVHFVSGPRRVSVRIAPSPQIPPPRANLPPPRPSEGIIRPRLGAYVPTCPARPVPFRNKLTIFALGRDSSQLVFIHLLTQDL